MPDQLRLLVVEDVPQVAQYIRGLLNTQSTIKLLDVVTDGSRVAGLVSELRPDVVLIDALLQGRVKGMNLVDQLNQSGAGIPVIVLTVPQQPVAVDPRQGIHGVLSMPFTGYELVTRLQQVNQAAAASEHSGSARMITIFAPKGGVGKTTLAFNLAVAMGQQGPRTVLIDGSLQFGDMRALLKVPIDAPSLLDLPTDRIQESDLAGRAVARSVGHRHPARAAARRDGRDGHGARPREDDLAAAPRLRRRRRRHPGRRQRHQPLRSSTPRTRSSRSSPTTRRPSTARW